MRNRGPPSQVFEGFIASIFGCIRFNGRSLSCSHRLGWPPGAPTTALERPERNHTRFPSIDRLSRLRDDRTVALEWNGPDVELNPMKDAMDNVWEVVVIGAGAAGLMAGIRAGERGKR